MSHDTRIAYALTRLFTPGETITGIGMELGHVAPPNTDKFYRIFLFGQSVIRVYGRNRTTGQIGIDQFNTPDEAVRSVVNKVHEKTGQGYALRIPPSAVTIDPANPTIATALHDAPEIRT